MLAKEWLLAYSPRKLGSPRERSHARQRLFDALEDWHVKGVIETMPVVVHLALFLFFAGLVIFVWGLDKVIGKVTLSILATTCGFYAGTVLIVPFVLSSCPYHSPMLQGLRSIWFSSGAFLNESVIGLLVLHLPWLSIFFWPVIAPLKLLDALLAFHQGKNPEDEMAERRRRHEARLDILSLAWLALESSQADEGVPEALISAIGDLSPEDWQSFDLLAVAGAEDLIVDSMNRCRSDLIPSSDDELEVPERQYQAAAVLLSRGPNGGPSYRLRRRSKLLDLMVPTTLAYARPSIIHDEHRHEHIDAPSGTSESTCGRSILMLSVDMSVLPFSLACSVWASRLPQHGLDFWMSPLQLPFPTAYLRFEASILGTLTLHPELTPNVSRQCFLLDCLSLYLSAHPLSIITQVSGENDEDSWRFAVLRFILTLLRRTPEVRPESQEPENSHTMLQSQLHKSSAYALYCALGCPSSPDNFFQNGTFTISRAQYLTHDSTAREFLELSIAELRRPDHGWNDWLIQNGLIDMVPQ